MHFVEAVVIVVEAVVADTNDAVVVWGQQHQDVAAEYLQLELLDMQ